MYVHTYHTYVSDVLLSFFFNSLFCFLFLILRRMGKIKFVCFIKSRVGSG